LLTRNRHRQALETAQAALARALAAGPAEVEIVAEELRAAAHALGRVTGRVDVEDVLGAIFAEFCIGK
jgi:tRNA modification GTPase